MKIKEIGFMVFAGLVIGLTLAASSQVSENPSVFRLGRFDGSSGEFSQATPSSAVKVSISGNSINGVWYAFQPVGKKSDSGHEEGASAPRVISFPMSSRPAPLYNVRVSLLIEHASVPALRIAINGKEGTFYLDPKLDSNVGDGGAVSFPSFSRATISFQVPGSFLHKGQNEIAFSAVANQEGPEVPDAGFNYDAIEMTEDSAQPAATALDLCPTIFYRQRNGHLEEAVDVIVRNGSDPVQTATVTLHGLRQNVALQGGAMWGEQKSRLYFPAFALHSSAHISLHTAERQLTSEQTLDPAKQWTIYVVPHVHLDLGYTDYQAKVSSIQSRIVDEALDLFAVHPEFRFSLDGMWSLEQFLGTRTEEDKARALAAMKAGQLFVPAEYNNELTGFASGETLLRSLYPSAEFSRVHGTPLNYADITDVPSYSWSYASILASAGIHELFAGSNNGRAPVLLRGHLDEASPFYWQGPDGQKVLFWYALHYHQLWTLFGLPPVVNAGEDTLPLFLQRYSHPGYKARSTIVYGSQVENTDLYPEQAAIVETWNKKWAYPHLQYSGFHEALTAVAAEFHGELPTVRGDGGPYWEDGIAADAFYAAMERETEARAPSAEKLATITSLVNSRMAVDKDSFHTMWKDMVLMDEHTWLSAESFSDSQNDEATVQLRVKDSRATQASELSDSLRRHSMADLADSIDTPEGSLVVFNTLNWKRSALVSVDVRKGFEIVDRTTGQPVNITTSDHGEHTNRVSFWAEDVPPVGYKTYLLRWMPSQKAASFSKPVEMENSYYRVSLDASTGAVRSVFDKQLQRELVDQASRYRLGEYLYVTTDTNQSDAKRFVAQGANLGKLLSVTDTPEGITAQLESTGVNTPHINTTITLCSHEKKLLFTMNLDKVETKEDEGVYFAFPFAMSHPQFQYEIQNGVVDPARDMYPGAGLDWFSVQHWAAVQQDGVSAAVMPLDAGLMTFGDISRLTFPKEFGLRKGTLFSYVMNNYWHTNYRAAQGGHFQFRYAITSAATTDAASLSRQGWEEITPFEVTEVTQSDKAVEIKKTLDGISGSFLHVDDPNLVLEAWKPAGDGRGTILRFLDLGGIARIVKVDLPNINVLHAWRTDALERDQSELAVSERHATELTVKPHEFVTLRILAKHDIPPTCGRYCELVAK